MTGCHAQLVDAVVQGGDVLFDGLLLHALGGNRIDGGHQFELGAVSRCAQLQINKLILQHTLCVFESVFVAKAHFNGLCVA